MKSKKTLLLLAALISAVFMFTACGSPGGADEMTPEGIRLVNTSFKISDLPYGSEGLKIVVRAQVSSRKHYDYEIQTVTSATSDVCIEKTIKVPETYNSLKILFLDENGNPVYYKDIEDDFKNQSGVYEIKGYYYYYYEWDSPEAPYAACAEAHIINAEYEKTYEFDKAEKPYLLFKFTGVKNTEIGIKTNYSENVDVYTSEDKDKIMKYDGSLLSGYKYESKSETAYILVRAKNYNKTASLKITFSNNTFARENGIEIWKALLASDGNLYVSGESTQYKYRGILWKINPATMEKTMIKDFSKGNTQYFINTIVELEPGTLYVSHAYQSGKDNISTVNLATGDVTTFVENLPMNAEAIVKNKDGKYVVTGAKSGSDGIVCVIDNGQANALAWNINSDHSYIRMANELFYFADEDLYIGSSYHISKNLYCMKFSGSSSYFSHESKYGSSQYSMSSPIKVFRTSPIQILTSDGKVYDIDSTKIVSSATNINNWCECAGELCKSYADCYLTNDSIYYMNKETSGTTVLKTIVEKCSLSNPKKVLEKQEYEGEKGIQFVSNNGKFYLLTNGTNAVNISSGYYDYLVYLHEIDF